MRSAQGMCSSSSSIRLPWLRVQGRSPAAAWTTVKVRREKAGGKGVPRCIPNCIALRYASLMAQVVARLNDDLVAAVDELVSEGIFESRSDAVRRARWNFVVDRQRRKRIGDAIVEGYRRIPQTEDEIAWADAATIEMIEEEPW